MPGKRAVEGASYVTQRALYRDHVIAGSESDPTDTGIPSIDTTQPPNVNVGMGQSDFNQYGKDARIFLAAYIGGFTSVTLDLWLKADINESHLGPAPSSSSTNEFPATDTWVKVASKVFTGPALWVITDIPPGLYKVLVSAASGGSGDKFVTLSEQHAA